MNAAKAVDGVGRSWKPAVADRRDRGWDDPMPMLAWRPAQPLLPPSGVILAKSVGRNDVLDHARRCTASHLRDLFRDGRRRRGLPAKEAA
jgi:hypothetical protein